MAGNTRSIQARTNYARLHLALDELGHPDRLEILDRCARAEGPLTPKELAALMGSTMGATAYHVRAMAAQGLLELHHESRVRGAIAHHYRLTARGRELERELLSG